MSLEGKVVINTRPVSSFGVEDKLTHFLSSAGARVLACPVIQLSPNDDDAKLRKQILESAYRTAVFVSATGVHYFIDFLHRESLDPNQWSENRQIACIGTGTHDALHQYGLSVDLIPPIFNSVSLANELLNWMPDPYLLIRASRGSAELGELLAAANQQYLESIVYVSSDVNFVSESTVQYLRQGQVSWITLTSSAIAGSCVNLFGELLGLARLICISESVANVVRSAGYANVLVAKSATFESMVKTMKKAG